MTRAAASRLQHAAASGLRLTRARVCRGLPAACLKRARPCSGVRACRAPGWSAGLVPDLVGAPPLPRGRVPAHSRGRSASAAAPHPLNLQGSPSIAATPATAVLMLESTPAATLTIANFTSILLSRPGPAGVATPNVTGVTGALVTQTQLMAIPPFNLAGRTVPMEGGCKLTAAADTVTYSCPKVRVRTCALSPGAGEGGMHMRHGACAYRRHDAPLRPPAARRKRASPRYARALTPGAGCSAACNMRGGPPAPPAPAVTPLHPPAPPYTPRHPPAPPAPPQMSIRRDFNSTMGAGSMDLTGVLVAAGKLSGARLVPAATVPVPPPARR